MTNEKNDNTVTDIKNEQEPALQNEVRAEEQPTLKEVIKKQVEDENMPLSDALTLGKILGGDILTTSAIKRQIWLVLLIVLFTIIYISNRYSCQQSLIEIDKLQKELQDAKYKAQSTTNRLTELSRESRVLEMLKECNDSTLHMANQPPYLINIPEK